jgi:hypothetical protein
MIGLFFEQTAKEIINQIKTLNDELTTTLGAKADDQWENINDQYEKFSSYLHQIFQYNCGFFQIISLYVQTFSVFKLKTSMLP